MRVIAYPNVISLAHRNLLSTMSSAQEQSQKGPLKVAMTLNIKPDLVDEYIEHHANPRPHIQAALHAVGLRNISLWTWGERLFYYAEYVGTEPFDDAMARYAKMDGVQEWEAAMHKYQVKIPGSEGDVWWQVCRQVYNQQ